MTDGWLGVMWAAFAAALLGVFVAGAAAGQAPSVMLVGALVLVPIVITLAHRFRRVHRLRAHRSYQPQRSLRWRREPRPVRPAVVPSARTVRTGAPPGPPLTQPDSGARSPELDEDDWSALGSLCSALDARHVDWLRTNDFVTPWLDGRARVVMDLKPLVAEVVDRPLEWEVRSALEALEQAIEPFVAFYDAHTFPDPLLVGGEWRSFELDQDTRAGGDTGDLQPGGRAAELHNLAVQVAEAYASLVSVAAQDVRVRKAVRSPV